MDDSLTVDYDRYYDRADPPSNSEQQQQQQQSQQPSSPYAPPLPSPLLELGKNLGFHKPPHSHRRSRSHGSEDDMPVEASGSGGTNPGLQDRILSKVLQQMLPSDYSVEDYQEPRDKRKDKDRPQFSLTLMSGNFRKFNARIGVVFVFQHRLFRLLQWRKPTHTMSALAVYSFVCLDPYLLAVLPVAVVLLFIMVPSFITRHPPPPSMPMEKYTAHGPAIAPPPEVKAVSEMSKDFFRNLRDLQNTMDDFSVAHDKTISLVGPPTNFSDEVVSSAVFIALFFLSILLFITAAHLPWRMIFLVTGWIIFSMGHPTLQEILIDAHNAHLLPREVLASATAGSFIHRDIILDAVPECREVEVFELQKLTSGGEYESWIFSPTPYEPMSAQRIAHERPKGTRFFEDVRCPPGWEWKDKKWTLDLGSTFWVRERYIGGVEIEEEGERWVYDRVEGEQGVRGEWRRRRWVRQVSRKYQTRIGEN
ncbi:unnamed protein product [Tuber melanosporum]|uniref:(Perigord truffle) hypothetical protein n=1 Tax=Tuber melanosporum (strain Mel28) TaxID=656061 RepID=D5GB10_TUBMM|nr:uncharacterized protein GSTUM_00005394001 [Tuber melanosporum]CAZ81703.1 unnamed protein product [Tuber melanosporum]